MTAVVGWLCNLSERRGRLTVDHVRRMFAAEGIAEPPLLEGIADGHFERGDAGWTFTGNIRDGERLIAVAELRLSPGVGEALGILLFAASLCDKCPEAAR